MDLIANLEIKNLKYHDNWKSPSLSELTPIIFDLELTHIGLEAPIDD